LFGVIMLARQRHQEILDRVGRAGAVRVTELARSLGVAEETIRRDLEKLDSEGKLVRTHGGAVSLPEDRREVPFDVRRGTHSAEKESVARAAARFVDEGDVIALDASSTAYCLARALPDRPLTVLTNSMEVATLLMARPKVQVVSTGGMLDVASQSFVGSFAEEALLRLHIGKLFLSSKGVDLARGLSEAADAHARLKRRMMDLADVTYLLADHSKFGVKSVVFFADVKDVDVVITDRGVDPTLLAELDRRRVRTEIVD
jgi:DeoR/GlpR family transcriptional regulator of sugar metabolism